MKILLDTHILLWWLADNPTLSSSARQRIANPKATIFVSTVSLWEIWLKQSLGKLMLSASFETKLADEDFESLPLLPEHARAVARLPWHHRDPFDRMLIAQAHVFGAKLLTADGSLAAYGDFVIMDR